MSAAEICRLWCLLENQPKPQPFSIQVKVDANIEDLKKEARKEKRKELWKYDASDIVFLKLNDPIQINPIETFTQRMVTDANSSIVELNDPSSKALDEFPGLPADRKVHIIVRCPPEIPPTLERASKRQKLEGESKVLNGLYMLYEQTWKRTAEAIPWFSLKKTKRDGTSTADVPEHCWAFSPPKDIASVIDLNPPTVLFRDEYLRAFSQLFASSGLGEFTPNLDRIPGATFPNFFSGVQVPQETPSNGLVLTGSPGIGKSIYLRIVLILRICARLPTFYQTESSSILFFSDEGLKEFHPDSHELKYYLRREPTAWALFDSTLSLKEPPDTFLTKKFFIFQTPSPRSDRLAWRSKFDPIDICCLGLWTPAELVCAAPFQRRRHDENSLLEFCKKYGYSARDAYANADSPARFEEKLQAYCGKLSYENAASIISDVRTLHFPDDLQHNIVCIIPTEVGLNFTFDFVSEYVYNIVLESLRTSDAKAGAKLYRLFLKNRKTRVPAGYMLEPAAHDILIDGGSFDIIRLESSEGRVFTHWKTPQIVSNEGIQLHITSSSISVGTRSSSLGRPPTFEFRKVGEGPLEHFGFYIPTSKSQATFDYLVYDPKDKHAWIFQVTIQATHSVNAKGIEELFDRGVEKITYIAITSDSPATIDLPFSEHLDEIVTDKFQLVLH